MFGTCYLIFEERENHGDTSRILPKTKSVHKNGYSSMLYPGNVTVSAEKGGKVTFTDTGDVLLFPPKKAER